MGKDAGDLGVWARGVVAPAVPLLHRPHLRKALGAPERCPEGIASVTPCGLDSGLLQSEVTVWRPSESPELHHARA